MDVIITCAICMNDLEACQGTSTLTCRHVFHSLCISRWLTRASTCPCCRATVPDSLLAVLAPRLPQPILDPRHLPFFRFRRASDTGDNEVTMNEWERLMQMPVVTYDDAVVEIEYESDDESENSDESERVPSPILVQGLPPRYNLRPRGI